MDTLVANLTAPVNLAAKGESSAEGYGNLDARGAVAGMEVPGVPDVSINKLTAGTYCLGLSAPRWDSY